MGGYIDPNTGDDKYFSDTEWKELKRRFRVLAERRVHKDLKERPLVRCACGCRIATPDDVNCARCYDEEAQKYTSAANDDDEDFGCEECGVCTRCGSECVPGEGLCFECERKAD